jgi:small-conductance mechanosensitive channel
VSAPYKLIKATLQHRSARGTQSGWEVGINSFRIFALWVAAAALSFCGSAALGQTAPPTSTYPDPQQVLDYLNQTIDWQRHIAVEEQIATDPSDVLFLNGDKQAANQILKLSFDFARADAQLLASQKGGTAEEQPSGGSGQYQSLSRAAAAADAQVKQTQTEIVGLRKKLETAQGRRRVELQASLDETQSELDLAQTRSQSLHNILQFVTGSGAVTGGSLQSQIDALQRSVPELETEPAKNAGEHGTNNGTATPTPNRASQPTGLVGLITDLFALSRKMNTLDQSSRLTDDLVQASKKLRSPLVASISAIAKQGNELAKAADTSGPAQLEQQRKQLDTLTQNFKQVSAVMVPLGKQSILLGAYKRNLERWRATVKSEYSADARSLAIRLAILGIVLAVIFAVAEVWKKATFRYIKDVRRRYQFLLLRRILLWCAIGITVAFALATEIGSIATFAGLITAGIAVALQNVILAIAGYFFLIGKYGVRVGDRVQISGVTGDVVDIGLVRLHLMEVSGDGSGAHPTGRVVVFSNAVVFQPAASFFKQIPGTSFVWHEVSLNLAPEGDYRQAEKRMLAAVEAVYSSYKERIEQQHREMERSLAMNVEVPRPHSRLRLTQSGLEVVIRYPVELQDAAEIDDRITRELMKALEQPPKLKLVGTGTPNIQPVAESTTAERARGA